MILTRDTPMPIIPNTIQAEPSTPKMRMSNFQIFSPFRLLVDGSPRILSLNRPRPSLL